MGGVHAGKRAYWQIDAPPGLAIGGAHTEGSPGMVSYGINQRKSPWGGGFYWKGGGAKVTAGQTEYSSPPLLSPYFGWQAVCGASTCNGASSPGEVTVLGLEIEGVEASGPSVAAQRWQSRRYGRLAPWPMAYRIHGRWTERRMPARRDARRGQRVAAGQ